MHFDVVARPAAQSQQTRLLDEDGNSQPDRPELAFNLDVVRPGTFGVNFMLEGAGESRRTFGGSAFLQPGQRQPLVSVSARELIELFAKTTAEAGESPDRGEQRLTYPTE